MHLLHNGSLAMPEAESQPLANKDGAERFLFHALIISLAGYLALAITTILVQAIALMGALALLILHELIRTRPGLHTFLARYSLTTWLPWLSDKINKRMVRPIEEQTRTSALDFAAGLSIIWLTCPSEALAVGCIVTAWADPCAREVGKRLGKTKWFWPGAEKTYVGSATCLLVGILAAGFALTVFYGLNLQIIIGAIAIALAGMGAELIPQGSLQTKSGKILSPADNFWLILATSSVATVFIRGIT